MIRRSAGCLGIDPAEPKLSQIEFVDKDVDHPNRIFLADPVFQTFWKQRVLTAIHSLNEAPHLSPPQIARESYRQNQIQQRVFTQPGSFASIEQHPWHVGFTPDSGRTAAMQRTDVMGQYRKSWTADWHSSTSLR